MGCIPEKIVRDDSDLSRHFVTRKVLDYTHHVPPARPLFSRHRRSVRNLSGWWTRRIKRRFGMKHVDADGGPKLRTSCFNLSYYIVNYNSALQHAGA